MKIDALTPETEILKELGRRAALVRKQQGYTQDDLATQAGLGVATLRRIEGGQDSQLESWLKLLKALDMVSAIDGLLPENFRSPMAEALADQKKRRKKTGESSGAIWEDERT
ncbi:MULTISPECIES: helix-turn-helix domain-containing protein [Kordiimonas]|jgi:transcriptional regulator with XRE-family HTH domain|uniref:helix-turn-helix domain-containing protein n=1 Tax=Kordiimonas TaxID=288021 RepID=UPI00257A7DAB|nr:helix-turn-helix domain-containing protein [Kordiimonas sp. UBA4487]